MSETDDAGDSTGSQSIVKRAARLLKAEHERRFAGVCDDRDLATKEDGDETVIYCANCRFVVERVVLGNGGEE